MIPVRPDLALRPLTPADHAELRTLMQRIYPPAYAHFWTDGGAWYLEHLYHVENFTRELAEPHTAYYFVVGQQMVCGILRVVGPMRTNGRTEVKLHRLYLGTEAQGRGIGQALVAWTQRTFCSEPDTVLWLEAMEKQPQALRFYEHLGFVKRHRFEYLYERLHPEMRPAYRMEAP